MTKRFLNEKGELNWFFLARLTLVVALLFAFLSLLLDLNVTVRSSSPVLMILVLALLMIQSSLLAYGIGKDVLALIKRFSVEINQYAYREPAQVVLSIEMSNEEELLPNYTEIKKLSVIRC